MNNRQHLIEHYKKKVVNVGAKNILTLYNEWLKKDYVVSAAPEEYEEIKRIACIEILDSDKAKIINTEKLNFMCFFIRNKGRGKEYHKILHSKGYEYNEIYAIFEGETNYIGSNCGRLFLDLVIERGIEEKDYQQNSIKLIEYLSRIEALEKGWY